MASDLDALCCRLRALEDVHTDLLARIRAAKASPAVSVVVELEADADRLIAEVGRLSRDTKAFERRLGGRDE